MARCLKLLIFILGSFSFNLAASTLLKQQIFESTSFVEGYVSNSGKEFVSISPVRWFGLEKVEFAESIKIKTFEGLIVSPGEHIVLILKNKSGVLELGDAGSSVYTVRRVGATSYLINKSKRVDPLQAQYALLDFYELVENIKNSKISKKQENYKTLLAKKRVELQLRTKKRSIGRKIASVDAINKNSGKKTNILWTLLLMCLITTVVRKLHKKL